MKTQHRHICHLEDEYYLKWPLAGGRMEAHLEYRYRPPLPKIKYDDKSKTNQNFWTLPGQHFLDPCLQCYNNNKDSP